MRRATFLIVSVLLAVPSLAHAKAGVIFDRDPEVAKVGATIGFTVMALRDAPRGRGEMRPVEGAHPLITFRSKSGRVIRVRASRTDLNGIGYGKVAFTDKGPWTTEMHVSGVHVGQELSQPIDAGIGLTLTIPSADEINARTAHASAGFPWVWVLSGASILAVLGSAGMRRRGHWRTGTA
jgi:hypothetical protein